MKDKTRILLIIIRIVCILLFPLSYVFDPTRAGEITFFTVQSNLLVLITMLISCIYDILSLSGKFIEKPSFLYKLKLISTASIFLTFIVFGVILTPIIIKEGRPDVVLCYSSIVMHQIIPIVALVDWCLDTGEEKLSLAYTPLPLVFPLYYFILTMILSNLGVTYPSYENGVQVEAIVPYFFLNYKKYGWFRIDGINLGVAYWLVILAVAISTASFVLLLIKRVIDLKKKL